MSVVELGPILALIGMVLLLLSSMGRQRARKSGQARTPAFLNQQRWLHVGAYGLILVGLLMMWAKK